MFSHMPVTIHILVQLRLTDLAVMMRTSNGNILRVTGHLCGEFTGLRWIPRTKASDAEFWCFLWSVSIWINGWENNREGGDLRRYRAHYDVIVLVTTKVTPLFRSLPSFIHRHGSQYWHCARWEKPLSNVLSYWLRPYLVWLNTSWQRDAYICVCKLSHHQFRWWLVVRRQAITKTMLTCVVNWVIEYSFQRNLNPNATFFIQQN